MLELDAFDYGDMMFVVVKCIREFVVLISDTLRASAQPRCFIIHTAEVQ
jgi:hypothetical protein